MLRPSSAERYAAQTTSMVLRLSDRAGLVISTRQEALDEMALGGGVAVDIDQIVRRQNDGPALGLAARD